MSEVLTGSIAGARFRLACSDPSLVDYARLHLARCLGPDDGRIDVDIRLRWHDGLPARRPEEELRSFQRVDRDLYVVDDCIRWFRVDDLRDLWLQFRWDGRCLRVDGDFHFRLGNSARSDRLRRLLQPGQALAQRRRRFTTLLYYLVYYPCWWWLEDSDGFHPIHAAAVNVDGTDGAILIGGGSGIGKSTLSLALAALPRARYLADSFVMHRGCDVRPVREPLLVDAASGKWLGEGLAQLEAIPWSYLLGRTGFHLPVERLTDSGKATMLLLPRRAAQAYVRRVEPPRAAALLSAGDLIINDLRRYFAFAAVLEYLVPRGLMARRETAIRDLTSSVPAFEIGLNLNQDRQAAVDSILNLRSIPL